MFASTGTHDLDTIKGPFIYDAQPPKDISFVPLNDSKEYRADQLLEHFSHDSHLKEYVPIIKVFNQSFGGMSNITAIYIASEPK